MAERSCCPVAGIGVHLLTPASTPKPLLDLLGLTDEQLQEVMAKDHPYGFCMGHNRNIRFSNYKEAMEALMERNLPQILRDRQTEAVFMPETRIVTIALATFFVFLRENRVAPIRRRFSRKTVLR